MARSNMQILLFVLCLCVPSLAFAGDYYIYKDAAGKITISNRQLSLPIVKQYVWPDATDVEIAATDKANRDAAILNKYLYDQPPPPPIIVISGSSSVAATAVVPPATINYNTAIVQAYPRILNHQGFRRR